MYGTILQQGFGPLFFLESYQYPVGEHQYRAFDQLAVRGQQCEQLVLGCRFNFVFKIQLFVFQTAGVEKFLHGQAAVS